MIRYVQVFGERCSGTNFLAALVLRNFADVEITTDFGGKHWFIDGHEPRGRPNETTDLQCVRPLEDSDDTLFLVIYRNPFDWLRSLAAKPYHAWGHAGLSFSEFLRKPWVSSETSAVHPRWRRREDGYYFIERAENVLSLRTLKIRHWQALSDVVPHIAHLRHEDLMADEDVLAVIAERSRIRLHHRPLHTVDRYFGGRPDEVFVTPRSYGSIADADLAFIDNELDWTHEARLGYSPSDYRP